MAPPLVQDSRTTVPMPAGARARGPGRRTRRAVVAFVLGALGSWPAIAQDEPASPGLEKRVDAAVDRGLKWLQERQAADGGYGVYEFHSNRTYVAGQTALALLARIASGENQYTASIERGFQFLRDHPPKLTYEVGLTLMAFDRKAAPVNERQRLQKMSEKERREYAWPRALEDRDRTLLQGLVQRLANECHRGCWSYGGYGTGEQPTTADTSNTQYAVLGLKAAARCGVEVDSALFGQTLEYFLDHQAPSGPKVKYVDVQSRGDGEVRKYARRAEARGFAYEFGHRGGDGVCASRTNIGIACLLLSQEELLLRGKGEALRTARRRRGDVEAAVRDALAWLDQNFAVETNPPSAPGEGYLYYYLYSLERTGALTHRDWIGEHDWYREGAEVLLARQTAAGSWPGQGWDNELVNTCFALLFLRRATVPGVVTGQD